MAGRVEELDERLLLHSSSSCIALGIAGAMREPLVQLILLYSFSKVAQPLRRRVGVPKSLFVLPCDRFQKQPYEVNTVSGVTYHVCYCIACEFEPGSVIAPVANTCLFIGSFRVAVSYPPLESLLFHREVDDSRSQAYVFVGTGNVPFESAMALVGNSAVGVNCCCCCCCCCCCRWCRCRRRRCCRCCRCWRCWRCCRCRWCRCCRSSSPDIAMPISL